MVQQAKFDELVRNCTKILNEHQKRIAELEARIKRMEDRKKPGPKPKQEAA